MLVKTKSKRPRLLLLRVAVGCVAFIEEVQTTGKHPKLTRVHVARKLCWAYLIVFSFTGFLLAAPPDKLVFYVIMGLLAVAILIVGLGRMKLIAITFLLLAVILSVREYQGGKELRTRIHQLKFGR